MSTQDEINRLTKLHRQALERGLDQAPEERAMLRVIVDKLAVYYARAVRERSPERPQSSSTATSNK